ncbi:uncharacterized protein LOC115243832 [Formica exsecta]|uniref:uncharacterized protein LOC115243832 n=1 Tax=Formica exsecta TaxID=72781 RepID=UPI0011444949|nr:uncharacterized protein LOC115243832 [Formica exsecta]
MEQLTEEQEIDDEEQIQEDTLIGMRQYEQLSREQKEIVDSILVTTATNNHSNNCFYINGPGGSDSTSNIKVQSKEAENLKLVDVFIVDEAPMAPQNIRALPKEREFAQFLLKLGNGSLNDQLDNIQIPERCIANTSSDIIKELYGDIIIHKRYKTIANYVILSARNADVNEINEKVVSLLDKTTERVYTSVDTLEATGDNEDIHEIIMTEYLNSLNPTCLLPHELRLRKYSVVILIRNLSINEGLCNGTRLLVLDLDSNLLQCEILTGNKIGEIVFLNLITLYCENVYPFTFKRRQFPVKLAFAMTINKSQGQTFDKIAIDLRKDVFNHGQLYVAFSRVRSWDSLKVYLGNDNLSNKVKNYVYKEILE